MVIAERAHLKCVGSIIGGFIFIVLCIVGFVFFSSERLVIGTFVCMALIVLFSVLILVDCVTAVYNNSLPAEAIVFVGGRFVVNFSNDVITSFSPSEIVKVKGQRKMTFFMVGYVIMPYALKYGKLRIWLREPGRRWERTVIELNNILDPEATAAIILAYSE